MLGQGMLAAGWHAHTLNAPGKFLVSAPEHTIPKRARGYLVTDQAVNDTAARYAGSRPGLDDVSRQAIGAAAGPEGTADLMGNDRPPGDSPPEPPPAEVTTGTQDVEDAQDALWLALCLAPEEGTEVGDLCASPE